jgi:hypothetical protein
MATTKTTAKKTTARRTTAARTTTKTAPKAATTKPAATKTAAATDSRRALTLGELDVKTVVTDSAYAGVGAGDAAVASARDLAHRLEALRGLDKDEAAQLVKANRAKAESLLKDVPVRAQALVKDVPGTARTLAEASRKEFDTYAARGRKVVESITNAPATKKALAQTDTARTQVKGAVTSVRKAVEQGQVALEGAVDKIGVRRRA